MSSGGRPDVRAARPFIQKRFEQDVRLHFAQRLVELGVATPADADVETVCTWFFNLRARLIPPGPRRVLRSRELQRALRPEHVTALSMITKESECGEDFRWRQSRKILKAGYNDALFIEWGIHHLHVGTARDPDRFWVQGEPLLFLMVDDHTLYMIDLLESGHGVGAFASDHLPQVLHDNWPDLIAHFRMEGVVPGSLVPSSLTPATRDRMRRKFLMGWQAADGTPYLPMGGGPFTSGGSINVGRMVDAVRTRARQVDVWVDQNAKLIAEVLRAAGYEMTDLHLRYVVGRSPTTVVETRAHVAIDLETLTVFPLATA